MRALCGVLAAALLVMNQAIAMAQGPAYIGVVEAVVNGHNVSLERQQIAMSGHSRALGFGGVRTDWVVPGVRSPVRFRTGDRIEFISRVESDQMDPSQLFQLYAIEPHKKERRLQMGSMTAFGSMTTGSNKFQRILNFTPYQKQFVKFSPASPLPAGEYIIQSGAGGGAFLFGID